MLDKVEIIDNGNGFNSRSLYRFKQLADRSKKLNNRGTGKIQIFHRFKEILVDSVFVENNETQQLLLKYDINDILLIKIKETHEIKARQVIQDKTKTYLIPLNKHLIKPTTHCKTFFTRYHSP